VAHAGVPRRVEAQQEKDLLRGAEGDRPGKAECHAQARRAGRENPKGKQNKPQQHSSNKETAITYSTSKVQEVEN
jgi:hypothetical protein